MGARCFSFQLSLSYSNNEYIHSSIIENIYNIIVQKEDYINPITNGVLIWRIIFSFDIDSKEVLEILFKRGYNMSTRRCAYIEKSLCCIGTKFHDLPQFYGTKSVPIFFSQMEACVPKN
jgi:hypothetical protein